MKHTLNALLATITDKSLLSISAALAGFKGVLDTYLFDDWFFLTFLLVIIGVDTISGTYKAWKKKTLESRAYARLFEKLLIYGCVLVMAHVLINFPIKGKPTGLFDWLDNVLYCSMMVREGISILENCAEINPKAISKKILAASKTLTSPENSKIWFNGDPFETPTSGEGKYPGILSVDGIFNCFVLEDTDRGLDAKMPLSAIRGLKVMGKTAIPTGRYRVEITHSPRFKKKLPILIGVPCFSGIRIHSGNWAKDTDGCLLPGNSWKKQVGDYMVTESRKASLDLQTDIAAAICSVKKSGSPCKLITND